MWALRRAANPLRSHSSCSVLTRALCGKSVIWSTNRKLEDQNYDGDSQVVEGFVLRRSFHSAPCALFFLGTQNLSSQAGVRTTDIDAGDGFSDLDLPPESDKIGTVADDEPDKELISEHEIFEDESAESVDSSLGLSDNETDSSGDKEPRRRGLASPLFKVIMEAPRHAVSSVLSKWVANGNSLDQDQISMTVRNLRKRRFYDKALQFVEWLEANKRLNFVERDYASHLDLIAKVHGVQKAEKYLNKIPETFRGEIIYRTLLANAVTSGNVQKSEEIFNKIRDLGLPITTFSCNQLLLLYKRVDRKKIPDVLMLMEKENVKPSIFTYRLLIDTKGRTHDIMGMEQIMERMKAEGMAPDVETLAMVASHYIFGGLNEKAEATMKVMEGDNIKDKHSARRSLLPLYAALGKAEDVGRVWKVCKANPRIDECLAAIEAWGKLGRVEDAEKVFEDTLKTWKKLSSRYYNALLKVYANHKLLSKGKDLAKRMSDDRCRIGPLTWDALVKLYVEAGEVEKADSILQKTAQLNQTRPLYSSYITVLEQYSKRGDIHNAEKIFHRLKQTGYPGRMTQYRLLLNAYVNAKTPPYGFRERMKADNVFPNKQVAAQLAAVDAFKKTHISEPLD